MRKSIQPRRAGRVHVTPAEITLTDLNLLICGWENNYAPGMDRALKTEEAFHDFLRHYGAAPRGWYGPHPPEGYNLELELEKISGKEDEDPRLNPSGGFQEPPARKQKASKPKRRPRLKTQVTAKAAKSQDTKPSPAPEAVKQEAKPKKSAWFYPAGGSDGGGSGGGTSPLGEPWPEPFEGGDPD